MPSRKRLPPPAMKPQGSTRPPKWPFLLGDAALLTVAIVIGFFESGPLSDTALVLIFSCVFIGAAVGVTPFFLDFSAARHDDIVEAREQLEILSQRLAESADTLGTASGHLRSINDITVKAIHLAESLPYRMQEKVGELTQLVQQGQDDEKEAMALELEELREAESRHLETSIEKARVVLEAAVKRVQDAERSLTAATAALEGRSVAPVPVVPEKEPHAAGPRKESPPPEPAPAEDSSEGDEGENGHNEKKRAPRARETTKAHKPEKHSAPAEAKTDPKPVEPAKTAAPPKRKPAKHADHAEHETLPGLDPVVIRDEDDASDEGASAKTSDGSTRLLVTAYIGIGNKVFVRGNGPGLKAEKGQPMEFVSIGKWLWQTSEATAPVTLQVYKNDEIEAIGDEITIDPGHHVEVTPIFRDPNPF